MGEFNILLGIACFFSISLGNLLSIGLTLSTIKKITKNKRFDLIPEAIVISLIIILPSFFSFGIGGYCAFEDIHFSKIFFPFVFFCVGISWTRSWWKTVKELKNNSN